MQGGKWHSFLLILSNGNLNNDPIKVKVIIQYMTVS